MSSLTLSGTLQLGVQHTIEFLSKEPQLWEAGTFRGIHVGRIALSSNTPDALDRLGHSSFVIDAQAIDRNDREVCYWRYPVNLSALLRNNMTHPFLDPDKFIPAIQSNHTETERIHRWQLTLHFKELDLLHGEKVVVRLTVS